MGYLEKTLDYIDKKFYQVKDEKEIYYKNLREQVEKSEIQVCIFGASEIGISLVQDLNKRGIKTKLFVDNDSKKWNKVIYGDVMCYEPQVLNTLSNPVVFLGLTAVNDVEKQLNIPKATIRFYEKEGLLSPKRNENSYREYNDEDIELLKKIIV